MDVQSEPEPSRLEDRVAALECAVADAGASVRTRRIAVVDQDGEERIVLESDGDIAEVRVMVPSRELGRSCMAVLFASPRQGDTGPGVGMQVWADGDAVLELSAWRDQAGRWDTNLHID